MILGVIGGGQLARMMTVPAINLGIDIRVLGEGASCSAVDAATMFGACTDAELVKAFADTVDVVTFDHEHVPQHIMRELVARGKTVYPTPDSLQFSQNKISLREKLAELDIASPEWATVSNEEELSNVIARMGHRVVVKTPSGGYDGKGVRMISQPSEVADWFVQASTQASENSSHNDHRLLVEECVDFDRELAQLVARNARGELSFWPLVETVQRDGVCREVCAPAQNTDHAMREEARAIAEKIAHSISAVGVMAVELFQAKDGRLLVNEIALRPHNSGHWSIDGAVTSQFEQHVRSVLGLPMGDTSLVSDVSVMVNLISERTHGKLSDNFARGLPGHGSVKVHNYGKELNLGRKIGHVTATGKEYDLVAARARACAKALS